MTEIVDERQRLVAVTTAAVACGGQEQPAFEAWAKSNHYEMAEHPLHYIFLDAKTNAARMGWNAALSYIRDALASPSEGNKKGDGAEEWRERALAAEAALTAKTSARIEAGLDPRDREARRIIRGFADALASRPQEQPRKATGEMVEAGARAEGQYRKQEPDWRGYADTARRIINAALAVSVSPAAAQGWQTVPVEATEAMLRDGTAAVRDFYSEDGPYPRAKAMYRAMLAAAPPSPAAQEQETGHD